VHAAGSLAVPFVAQLFREAQLSQHPACSRNRNIVAPIPAIDTDDMFVAVPLRRRPCRDLCQRQAPDLEGPTDDELRFVDGVIAPKHAPLAG
jgi:hypothetical protein